MRDVACDTERERMSHNLIDLSIVPQYRSLKLPTIQFAKRKQNDVQDDVIHDAKMILSVTEI